MTQPTTARFGKFRVLLGAPTGVDPAPVSATSVSNTNPALVTVAAGDIGKFQNGMQISMAGLLTDMAQANGAQTIANVDAGGTFELVGEDLSAAAAPQTTTITADPPKLTVYTAPCGFTTKSFILTKNLTEVNIPDCDNPDEVAWVGRDAASLTAQITGEGVAAAESVPAWNEAWQSQNSVAARVEIEFSTGMLIYEGLFQVESLTFGAEQGGRVTLNVSMQSDGIIVDSWQPLP